MFEQMLSLIFSEKKNKKKKNTHTHKKKKKTVLISSLTFTTPWALSAEDKSVIFFPENRIGEA